MSYKQRLRWRSATKGAPLACAFLLMAAYATLGSLSTRWTEIPTTLMILGVFAGSYVVAPRLPQWQDRLEFSRWHSRPDTGTGFEIFATVVMVALLVFCVSSMVIGAPAPWMSLAAIWAGAVGFGWLVIRRNPGFR
ncbi:hypothetical protein [Arthrobacter sp. ERGS1:01]|uniref:hypothetical protein n=1 Tax=Arthrobacter sp. ERGS1:01 TaxID=1704044 RepID=UPI0012373EE0|nr:hypothetical protein [Arthrobacter sp. ERGS1:01]